MVGHHPAAAGTGVAASAASVTLRSVIPFGRSAGRRGEPNSCFQVLDERSPRSAIANERKELRPKRRTDMTAGNTNTSDSFPYPRGRVVGVLNDDASFEDARRRLD